MEMQGLLSNLAKLSNFSFVSSGMVLSVFQTIRVACLNYWGVEQEQ